MSPAIRGLCSRGSLFLYDVFANANYRDRLIPHLRGNHTYVNNFFTYYGDFLLFSFVN